MKQLMTANEAIARGFYEAGGVVAAAYPGTPSTEILENINHYKDEVYCEWSSNEKTALETAIGASIGGVRALAAMKHVGLNVAADPLFTVAYTGVNGGLVIVSADDPSMHSSQNEQDNRHYARAAKICMLEPSDSQEAKNMVKAAFAISEKFDVPVLLLLHDPRLPQQKHRGSEQAYRGAGQAVHEEPQQVRHSPRHFQSAAGQGGTAAEGFDGVFGKLPL